MTAAPLLALVLVRVLVLVLGWLSWQGWLLRLVGPGVIRHHDSHVNISAFVVIRGAQFELHIFINAELDVIQIILLTAEVNIAFSIFFIVVVAVFFSFVANKLLIVVVSRLATLSIGVSFAPIAALVVHRLLLNLVEVLRVKLQGSHLLSMRQVMTLILEKVIIVFFVRCEVQHLGYGRNCEILRIFL